MKTIYNYLSLFAFTLLSFSVYAQSTTDTGKDLLFLAEFDNHEEWYNKAFKTDALRRSKYCLESNTLNGKINDKSSLVVLRDFKMDKMAEFTSDKAMTEIMNKYNIRHNEVYEIESLGPNNMPEGKTDLFFIVDMVDYDMWLWDAFLSDGKRRAQFCDESRTRVAKINDKKSMVILYDFDMSKMKAFESDEKVGKIMMEYQVNHDVYTMKSL